MRQGRSRVSLPSHTTSPSPRRRADSIQSPRNVNTYINSHNPHFIYFSIFKKISITKPRTAPSCQQYQKHSLPNGEHLLAVPVLGLPRCISSTHASTTLPHDGLLLILHRTAKLSVPWTAAYTDTYRIRRISG